MYEIWSVRHKPFEDYANNRVCKFITADMATLITIYTGDPIGRHRVSSPPSSWLSPYPLQYHDIMLVKCLLYATLT